MKKIKTTYCRFALFGLLILAGISSCDVHEFPSVEEKTSVTLEFRFDTVLPLHQTITLPSSKAASSSAEDYDLRYTINIYRADEQGNFGREACTMIVETKDDVTALEHSVTLEMESGVYRFIAWTDYVDAGSQDHKFYNTDRFEEITLYGEEHYGNCLFRDAFRGSADLEIATGENRQLTVDMERPLARYSFIATDLEEFITKATQALALRAASGTQSQDGDGTTPTQAIDLGDYRVIFRYTGYMPSSFNLFTDKPADVLTGVEFEGSIKQLNDKEAELGFDYVFVNGTESSVQVAVAICDQAGNLLSQTEEISVPVVRSKHTTVKGEFLTTEASGSVGISPGFDGEWNVEIQ